MRAFNEARLMYEPRADPGTEEYRSVIMLVVHTS